ncbi:hypothetical protein Tco_0781709 [Tanacetum coccineum]
MKQDNAKQTTHDEKLVPSDDKVKIGKSNLRIYPFITQREETYQVVQDIIKNTPFYNAFLISADRTFGAIINKCLLGKTLSNDKLRPSRIGILWGIYHNANVDYATLIWEDLQYHIDNCQKVRRHEIIPYPRFTKAIIHHFMTKHKSISSRHGSPYHTVDDDEVLDRLKFINKGEIYQVYGKPILDTWITDEIKKFEAYKVYFKYSTGLIPPKKGRGRGAQGTKAIDAPK